MDDAAPISSATIELTRDILSAYVLNNNVPVAELPGLIASVHAVLSGLGKPVAAPEEDHKVSAAQIRKSVTPDHIISFLDGRPYKTLKRHLTTRGYTPDEYRKEFGLGHDYPMVSARYAAKRSELAKSLGLGQIRSEQAVARKAKAEMKPTAPAARRGRPRKAAAAAAE